MSKAEIRKDRKPINFRRGSIDCNKPFFNACSSDKTEFLMKESVLAIERSIKLFLNPKFNFPS
jgi:hypothetical protein